MGNVLVWHFMRDTLLQLGFKSTVIAQSTQTLRVYGWSKSMVRCKMLSTSKLYHQAFELRFFCAAMFNAISLFRYKNTPTLIAYLYVYTDLEIPTVPPFSQALALQSSLNLSLSFLSIPLHPSTQLAFIQCLKAKSLPSNHCTIDVPMG